MPPKMTAVEQLQRIFDAPERLIRAGDPVIDPFREAIAKRNGGGYIALVRLLRTMDNKGSTPLSSTQFHEGLEKYQVHMRKEDVDRLFRLIDRGNKGLLSVEEFMRGIRPEMSMARRDLIIQAFTLLDENGEGRVPYTTMRKLADFTQHPAVIAGRQTQEALEKEFDGDWDRNHNGIVTLSEFFEYYNSMSASIANDDFFELMVRNMWHVYGGEGLARNTTCMKVNVTFEDGRHGMYEVRNDLHINKNDIPAITQALVRQGLKCIKSVTKV